MIGANMMAQAEVRGVEVRGTCEIHGVEFIDVGMRLLDGEVIPGYMCPVCMREISDIRPRRKVSR